MVPYGREHSQPVSQALCVANPAQRIAEHQDARVVLP